jgi:hypothetical protein
MLRGLPGIRLKSVFVRWYSLGEHPPFQHLSKPSIFKIGSPNTIFRLGSSSRPSRGTSSVPKWDANASAWIWNTWKCNRWCITYSKQGKHHVTLHIHMHFTLLNWNITQTIMLKQGDTLSMTQVSQDIWDNNLTIK